MGFVASNHVMVILHQGYLPPGFETKVTLVTLSDLFDEVITIYIYIYRAGYGLVVFWSSPQ
jgi:hypothetical protein